jgi:hypothetical protein
VGKWVVGTNPEIFVFFRTLSLENLDEKVVLNDKFAMSHKKYHYGPPSPKIILSNPPNKILHKISNQIGQKRNNSKNQN